MAEDPRDFLRRWSRRKRKAAAAAVAPAAPEAKAPELPPLDSLSFESDFKAFMHSKVEESVKRAALKKLFTDPRFNVIDPLDIDIDDYSKLESLPQAAVDALAHAKRILAGPVPAEEKAAEGQTVEKSPAREAEPQQAASEGKDGAPGQDA